MAGSAGAIRAGKAFVELFTDKTKFDKGLAAASAKLKAWGATVSSMGTKLFAGGLGLTAGLLGGGKVFADLGSELIDASDRTGIGVEKLSALKFAAEQSGASFEDLEKGIGKWQQALVKGADGSKEIQEALDGLNLSLGDLAGLRPEGQLSALADAISKIENPARRSALAQELFSKSGRRLLPFFKDGAKGLAELEIAAHAAGVVMKQEDAVAAEAFGDSLSALNSSLKFTYSMLGGALAPGLNDLAKQLTTTSAATGRWLRENAGLVTSVFQMGIGVTAAGAAIYTLGKGMAATGILVGAVKAVLTPLGMLTAGLGGLGYLWLTQAEYGKTFWNDLKGTATMAWGGIVDAIMAGDLQLAGKIATQSLKIAWMDLIAALTKHWSDFVRSVGVTGQTTGNEIIAEFGEQSRAGEDVAQRLLRMRRERANRLGPTNNAEITKIETELAGMETEFKKLEKRGKELDGILKTLWTRRYAKPLEEEFATVTATMEEMKAKAEQLRARLRELTAPIRQSPLADASRELFGPTDREMGRTPAEEERRRELDKRDALLAEAAAERERRATTNRQRLGAAAGLFAELVGRGGVPGALNGKLGSEGRGTFNPFALRSLQSGPATEAVKEAKKANEKLAKIVALLEADEGPAFA